MDVSAWTRRVDCSIVDVMQTTAKTPSTYRDRPPPGRPCRRGDSTQVVRRPVDRLPLGLATCRRCPVRRRRRGGRDAALRQHLPIQPEGAQRRRQRARRVRDPGTANTDRTAVLDPVPGDRPNRRDERSDDHRPGGTRCSEALRQHTAHSTSRTVASSASSRSAVSTPTASVSRRSRSPAIRCTPVRDRSTHSLTVIDDVAGLLLGRRRTESPPRSPPAGSERSMTGAVLAGFHEFPEEDHVGLPVFRDRELDGARPDEACPDRKDGVLASGHRGRSRCTRRQRRAIRLHFRYAYLPTASKMKSYVSPFVVKSPVPSLAV